jgi:mono/diheme cytochrome c family protein
MIAPILQSIAWVFGLAAITAACQAIPAVPSTPTELAAPTYTLTPAPTSTPEMVLQGTGPDRARDGRMAYLEVCAACHGMQAEGYANDLAAPALDASEHAPMHPDPQIHDWIVNGKLGLGGQMPAIGDQLKDEEVHAIIAYLHTLWTPDQLKVQQVLGRRWPATPEPTWTPRP